MCLCGKTCPSLNMCVVGITTPNSTTMAELKRFSENCMTNEIHMYTHSIAGSLLNFCKCAFGADRKHKMTATIEHSLR